MKEIAGVHLMPWVRSVSTSRWVPFGLSALLYAAAITTRLIANGGDPSFFVVAGDRFCDPAKVPDGLSVLRGSSGYDGQFYYRLALQPFSTMPSEFGIQLDLPAYRQQRILYPLLSWVGSGGHAQLVPVAMILLNYVAICAIALMSAYWAASFRQRPYWGLMAVLYPGFVLTVARDLTEAVEISLLLLAWVLVRNRRLVSSACVFGLALLARETAMVSMAALGVEWIAARSTRTIRSPLRWWLFLFPLAVFSAWQAWLRHSWGHISMFNGGIDNLGIPFRGVLGLVLRLPSLGMASQALVLAELSLVGLMLAAAVSVLPSSPVGIAEKIAVIGYGLLVVTLSDAVWVEDWGFLRSASELYVFGALVLMASPSRLKGPTLCIAVMLWLVLCALRLQSP